MAMWLQHILVLALAGGCVLLMVWQAARTLRGRKGGLGCCARGCLKHPPAARGVAFVPATALRRR